MAGSRGFGVFVSMREGSEPRFILQHRSVDPGLPTPNTDYPISLVSDVQMQFCPLEPYERARTLETSAKLLSSDQRRIVTDQLVMAYGISGQFKKAHELLDDVIPQDPEYPLNYYNLACAFAEEGNKGKMLASLDLAFQHKDHMLKGEQMPDPRSDSSFLKYVQDEDFLKLMKKLGFK
jgi:tetratricopeptide (TPR) repeat protein